MNILWVWQISRRVNHNSLSLSFSWYQFVSSWSSKIQNLEQQQQQQIVECMWDNSTAEMPGLHITVLNAALASCRKAGPILFPGAGLEHQFGGLNVPLSSVSNWYLWICHPIGSLTNYFNNQISFSFVFLILTSFFSPCEDHLFYGAANTDISSLVP